MERKHDLEKSEIVINVCPPHFLTIQTAIPESTSKRATCDDCQALVALPICYQSLPNTIEVMGAPTTIHGPVDAVPPIAAMILSAVFFAPSSICTFILSVICTTRLG